VLDFPELLARVENDRELMRDLLSIFKKEFPQHLHSLRQAVESRDAERVSVAAHTLKGMLLNVAATQAASAAAQLERLGRVGKSSEFQAGFAALESEAGKLLSQVEAYVTEAYS
jgi:two-component system, sensor histidine kinase and response regulator